MNQLLSCKDHFTLEDYRELNDILATIDFRKKELKENVSTLMLAEKKILLKQDVFFNKSLVLKLEIIQEKIENEITELTKEANFLNSLYLSSQNFH